MPPIDYLAIKNLLSRPTRLPRYTDEEEALGPTEHELMEAQQAAAQHEPGQAYFVPSRESLKETGMAQLRRTLGLRRLAVQEKLAPEYLKRQTALEQEQMRGQTARDVAAISGAAGSTALRREIEERKQAEAADTASRSSMAAQQKAQDILKMTSTLKAHPGKSWSVGARVPFGTMIPGSNMQDFEARRQQLVDTQVVALIQELKRLSATGATGFGQLSEKEGARLENASSRLTRAQNESSFNEALDDLQRSASELITRLGQPSMTPGQSITPSSAGARPTAAELIKKYRSP